MRTGIVWSSLRNHKKRRFFLLVCAPLVLLLPSQQLSPALKQKKKKLPQLPRLFRTFPLFICGSATGVSFYSCSPGSVSKWQWWESTVAMLTRSDARTGNGSTCMDVAQWHTHMTYCHCGAKWRPSRHRYSDMICCGSKVTAPSINQRHVHYSRSDTVLSAHHFDPSSCSMLEITNAASLLTEHLSILFCSTSHNEHKTKRI